MVWDQIILCEGLGCDGLHEIQIQKSKSAEKIPTFEDSHGRRIRQRAKDDGEEIFKQGAMLTVEENFLVRRNLENDSWRGSVEDQEVADIGVKSYVYC